MKMNKFTLFAISMFLTSCVGSDIQYDASGVFETTDVIVSAKESGEIQAFDVEEGHELMQGQVVGVIDTMQLSLQERNLAANLRATNSRRLDVEQQVASIRQQIANLERERQRYAELLAAKAATQKQVDDIDYQIEVLNRELDAVLEQIASSNNSLGSQSAGIEAQREQMSERIRNSIIISPITGTVLAKYAEVGEYAVPGKALFKVGNLCKMKLRAYITADQLADIRIGQDVKVYADWGMDGRREYAGKICWIADKAEFTPKTIQTRDERANLVYAVKIEVENDGLIKRGMYGDVKF